MITNIIDLVYYCLEAKKKQGQLPAFGLGRLLEHKSRLYESYLNDANIEKD